MQIRLFDWAPSPFCLKIRAILEYKNITFDRVDALGPALFRVRRHGKVGKFPALEIDGEMFVDSTDIAYELDRRFPEPPLMPVAQRDRAFCHVLEDWCDEALYFLGLYFQWQEPEGAKMVPKAFGRSSLGRIAYLYYRARVVGQIKAQGTARKPPRHVQKDLERELDALQVLLQPGPFLLGAVPYLCDFALLGQLVYLARTPVGHRLLDGRTTIEQFRDRMKSLRT